jgi:hypothetical protein
MVQFRAYFI